MVIPMEHVPSLGIGLYSTRALVERPGGRHWLESREGAGSIFYVTLPLADEAWEVSGRSGDWEAVS